MKKTLFIFLLLLSCFSLTGCFSKTYTVSFNTVGGTPVASQRVKKNNKAKKPTDPTKDGYTFDGWFYHDVEWNFDVDLITQDITLKAFWIETEDTTKTYTVTFDANGGSEVASQSVKKGNKLSKPDDPVYPGHTFSGWFLGSEKWNFENDTVKTNIILQAQWDVNVCKVTFDYGDRQVQKEVNYGGNLNEPTNPTKEGYKFIGWFKGNTKYNFKDEVTEDFTLTIKWEINEYLLIINRGPNTTPLTIKYKFGETVKSVDIPEVTGKEFLRWEPSIPEVMPSHDVEITPIYKNKVYTISFNTNGGSSLNDMKFEYGDNITNIPTPTKSGYRFVGWNPNIPSTMPAKDLNVTAIWELEEVPVTKFTVTFKGFDGKILKTEEVLKGKSATAPLAPDRIGYTFTGWDKQFNNVTTNLIVTATYSKNEVVVTKYIVTFKDYDGRVLKTEEVVKGESATAPKDPNRSGYTFTGWDKQFNNVLSNLTITATYSKNEVVVTKYTVTFKDYDGRVLKTEEVVKGESATAPKDPSRSGYTFTGWDKQFNNVLANLTITATYSKNEDNKTYNIIYNLNGGSFGYSSKNEYVSDFLRDFYDFVKPTESLNKFMHDGNQINFKGTWVNYIGGKFNDNNKLLYNNNLSLDNEAYFFNCSKYKAKWANLGEWVASQNNRFNGSGGYTYGALDFYRYIIDDPEGYINVYGEKFHSYPKLNEPTVNSFKQTSLPLTLHTPLSKKFKGWYLDSNFTGSPVTVIPSNTHKDFEVYAKWDDVITYEVYIKTNNGTTINPITVKLGDIVTLPTNLTKPDYKFTGWYLGNTLLSNPFTFNYNESITVEARWQSTKVTLTALKYDGTSVKYRNSSTEVMIPTGYVQPDSQLRAAWVSSFVDDFKPSTNEATMKHNLLEVLDFLESYNMNCIIFHIRTMNNAFYKTKMAPIHSSYGTYQTFENWDYLTWFISECHKRGIEFHAWMNPYRIKSYGYSAQATPDTVSKDYKDYPLNAAHNPENILMTYRSDGTQGAILNPAKTAVQDYIVDTCLEVIENYDVDAIHFDDYFYAQMSQNINILSEPDQQDYINYCNSHSGFNKNSSSDKADWRRMNVDNFISKLSKAIRNHNTQNNKHVQLGIAPTGIYKNGNGTVNSGSNTGGQEHYQSYLFCDTLKWVKNEWIDYILPQSYWAFTHRTAGYADVMDWWNKAVEGTRVNLYSGIGLYMSEPNTNYSWGRQPYEVSNQILYTTKLKNVKGVSFFAYKHLKNFTNNSSSIPYDGLLRIKNSYWTTKVSTPLTMASK